MVESSTEKGEKDEVELELVTQWSHRLSQCVLATIPICVILHVVAPAATAHPASLMLCSTAAVVSLWLVLIAVRFRHNTHLWTYANLVTITRFAMAIVAAIWWRDGLLSRSEETLPDGSPNGCTGAALALVALVFIAADFLDGWLARSLQQCSSLGACIDEEADSFATLIVGLVLWRRRLAVWPVLHMAFAHYICLVVRQAGCPHFQRGDSQPFARYFAGFMAISVLLAFVVEQHAPALACVLGNGSAAINLYSFGCEYLSMLRHKPPTVEWLRARRRIDKLVEKHGHQV